MSAFSRVLCVWRRNLDVYMVTWKVNFLPPLLEPMFYLLAFGAGLGGFVKVVPYSGGEVSYTAFIAPGMVGISIMFQSFFECTYGSYIRMYYQKTFDAIIATPLSIEEVITGELLWGGTKAFISVAIMSLVVRAFGYMKFPDLLALPFLAFVCGLFFAGVGMCYTSIAPSIDSFNYPIFLFITPMSLFGGTYFPIEGLPGWAQKVAIFMPLTHVTEMTRAIAFGRWDAALAIRAVVFVAAALLAVRAAVLLMRRRLVV
ncbi:MAG: ABC transporter permease [Planctomycetes bacterium]|nr:ABC transporter permease [Planctomycetota bacterium]